VGHVDDRHYAFFVIDSVDHAISTAADTEPVVHRREQPLADPVRIGKQRSREELISGSATASGSVSLKFAANPMAAVTRKKSRSWRTRR
jgi:hypothetical protein